MADKWIIRISTLQDAMSYGNRSSNHEIHHCSGLASNVDEYWELYCLKQKSLTDINNIFSGKTFTRTEWKQPVFQHITSDLVKTQQEDLPAAAIEKHLQNKSSKDALHNELVEAANEYFGKLQGIKMK